MNSKITDIEKYMYKIIAITFFIIVVSSLESLMLAKSVEMYDQYILLNPGNSMNDYIGIVILNFMTTIFEPVILTIFTLFTYKKYGISKLYKFIFSIVLALRLFNIIISLRTYSIFYYALIILYIILIMLVIRAPKNKRKVTNVF